MEDKNDKLVMSSWSVNFPTVLFVAPGLENWNIDGIIARHTGFSSQQELRLWLRSLPRLLAEWNRQHSSFPHPEMASD